MLTKVQPLNRHPALVRALFVFLGLVYLFFVIQRAWVGEDAYITLRTVNNFLHGYGLTWNTFERVQAFTHPLWTLVLAGVIAFTHEYFYTTVVVGVLFSAATLGVLFCFMRQSAARVLLIFMALITSNAYLDYSTSGLDNPLSHFLAALFFLVLIQSAPSRRKALWGSLLAALGMVNRLDNGVLLLPGLVYLLYKNRKDWALVLAGLTPLIAWELFALLYYGFPFPNTAYAKLYTGIPQEALTRQGWLYLSDAFNWDLTTPLACLVAVIAAFQAARTLRDFILPVSLVLFIAYDIHIGGDFMRGRFLTLPFLCAVLILSATPGYLVSRAGPLLALFFVVGNLTSTYPFYKWNTPGKVTSAGVADERGFYLHSNSLSEKLAKPELELPTGQWVQDGKRLRAHPPENRTVIFDSIGMRGFFAGPEIKMIDIFGLSDPLLARLPIDVQKGWRIGHFRRLVPTGYLETVASGTNQIRNPKIAAYYDQIKLITQAPLFAPGRIAAIFAMNLGIYENLIR